MENLINEIYKPVHKVKEFRKVISRYKNNIWSMDLVFMNDPEVLKDNKGYKYILFCIDVYSRYAFGRKLKGKTAEEVLQQIQSIIKEAGSYPEKLYVDQGSEFYNKKIQKFLDEHNIVIYSTYGPHKASIIERFNRTIKNNMYKKMLLNRS